MKKILGLDLGTTSIGWAYVNEAENENEKSSIEKLGVRVIPISTDEENDFLKGKATSINADRTLKRGARRNLDRYQLRRKALLEVLLKIDFINASTILSEDGKNTTFSTYELRAKAVCEKISKENLAKVFLMINKKRGYKSSRKAQSDDEGTAIDGMEVAKTLYEKDLTSGQYVYEILKNGKKHIPDFYRSDLISELDKIWNYQKQFYPEILNDEFREQLNGKGKQATSKIFLAKYGIYLAENKGKRDEAKLQAYKWRSEAFSQQLTKEEVAYVIVEINNNINSSSGYLGAISDRSKELIFNKQTVGEYLFNQLKLNSHTRLKNQVFYRQDYLDEFNAIWGKQKEFYPELTPELKTEIRDIIIFYQRRLKSQKHHISNCEFEKHHKAIPKSSPLFQEFKIWQILNNLEIKDLKTREKYVLELETKQLLFQELNIRNKLTDKEVLKILSKKPNEYELNFNSIEGNRTNAALYQAYQKILEFENEDFNFSMKSDTINEIVSTKFLELGINTDILSFDTEIEGNDFDKQAIMQLWHLLYSYEGDNSQSGIEKLLEKLETKFGFKKDYAKIIANIKLQDDHGSLCNRAIRKILPHLKEGNGYDVACFHAGYNHSHSLNKNELASRELKNKLELLPKNSLRNPIVEKILNQMVNVINAIIADESLGKPDEIRIELARDLKKSAKEREKATKDINQATIKHDKIRKLLQSDFGITKVTRNDIIRYKLWQELESNGHKTIYTNKYIPKEKLFSKEFDIEHIIPQAKLFDDSFSNKTLSKREVNIRKSNDTAYDFLKEKELNEVEFEQYLERIESLLKRGIIKKSKYNKLKMKSSEIPDGFIDRDLRNSQYIAKKAKQMLEEVVRTVNTTTGSITNRLRSDWQLVNVMKDLNFPKYDKLGLIETIEGKNGREEKKIKDWTKRNDHRHHAMDALTAAFTSYSHVQYLNNLNARNNETHKKYHEVYGIEQKYLYRDKNNKLLFKPPMQIDEFRAEAKKQLENILISFKAKNKVVTRNKNKIKAKGKDNHKEKIELTPRGQLHKETVYGKIQQYETKEEKIGTKFDLDKIKKVAKQSYREALLMRLAEFEGNPKKAFGGKNSPTKNPIYIDEAKTIEVPEKVKLVWKDERFTKREKIAPDLFKDSKKKDDFYKRIGNIYDEKIKQILTERYENTRIEVEKFNNSVLKVSEKKKVLETAFSNLDENPIWLNEEKSICIKRVTISGVSNVIALHDKKDHNGKLILDENGNKQAVDFVSTGNNHHVAIYQDEKGDFQEDVVSFYQAVERSRQGLPIINKSFNKDKGWEFLFTMKQNEYFVFPSDVFNPNEIDLLNPENAGRISPNLFRVQKIAAKNYMFRHHLETNVDTSKELDKVAYRLIQSTPHLVGIIKVRINHLGQIVKEGEY